MSLQAPKSLLTFRNRRHFYLIPFSQLSLSFLNKNIFASSKIAKMPSLIKNINKKIERRLIEIEDENLNDTKIEKKLDKCRRFLMIGLALIGVLYYIAFEFDGLESQSSMVKKISKNNRVLIRFTQKRAEVSTLILDRCCNVVGSSDRRRFKSSRNSCS